MYAESGPPYLKSVVKACQSAFVSVAAFSFVINLLMLAIPVYMLQLFDRVMTSHSEGTLAALTVAAVLALAVMAVLDIVRSRMLVRIGRWLDAALVPELFAAGLDSGRFPQHVRGLAQIRNLLTGVGVFAILDAPWVPLFIALIFYIHPTLGAVAVIGAVVILGLAWVNEVFSRAPLRAANEESFRALSQAEAICRQGDAIRSMGMADALSGHWRATNDKAIRLQAAASDLTGPIVAISKFVRLGVQVFILAVAASLVIQQELSAGAMIAASIILARALAPVEQSIGMWRSWVAARQSFHQIADDLKDHSRRDAMPLPRPDGRLKISGVSFTPDGTDEPVLEKVSFTVEPGTFVAITGSSGAGKSSLVRMLTGVVRPSRGEIRLDDADVFAWDAGDLGQHMGYVPQITEMLPGSVRANIARFTDATPEAVIRAAKKAGVHELVLKLPQGYETMLGGRNEPLSAGARQRLSLARALFGNPQVLILDEPYSNLDADGVAALMAAITEFRRQGGTVVMVAHRPSIIAHADTVVEIRDGVSRQIDRRKKTGPKLYAAAHGEGPEQSPVRNGRARSQG